MSNLFHSWRAAIRIARRDAWRFKGRSFLVLTMIALPVVGVSAMDLTIRSASLTTEQELTRDLGSAAARFIDPHYSGEPILQSPDSQNYRAAKEETEDGDGSEQLPDGHADLVKSVPSGAKSLTDTRGYAKLRTAKGLLNAEVRELKAADPMTRGIMTLRSGRFPEKAGEAAVTTHFLETSGLKVGSKLTARGLDADFRIVGSYELPSELKSDQVNVLPGALLAPLGKAMKAEGRDSVTPSSTLLIGAADGFTWNMVQEANAQGVLVKSRAVVLNPPADADVPLYQREDGSGRYDYGSGTSTSEQAVLITIVGLAVMEICLLAGAAFAVGARRSRRQLGLVGANGGDRSHIRAIVLAGGLVIGVVSAVTGTVLGIALTAALRPLLEDYLGQRFGGLSFRPLELLAIALVAVITGLVAALVPAITASRESVLASLTGRRGIRRSNRVLPALGLAAVLLGAAVALYGALYSKQTMLVMGGSVIAELGVIAMTPALVGLFGKIGTWLPLSPRLALRDAVRNRGRTAPAVAAVLAAVAGTVAISTYSASQDVQGRAEYVPRLPSGAVEINFYGNDPRDITTVRSAVEKTLPVDVRAPVSRLTVGGPSCTWHDVEKGCGTYDVIIPEANKCPLMETGDKDESEVFTPAQLRKLNKDWRCENDPLYGRGLNQVIVGDAELLKVLGIDDPGAAKALADGKIVSLHKPAVDTKGEISIVLAADAEKAEKALMNDEPLPGEIKKFPAYQVPGDSRSYGVSVLLTAATAEAAGFGSAPTGAYYSTTQAPSADQEQRLESELAKTGNEVGSEVELFVEHGYSSRYSIVLLALTVFAGLVTIGAAGIATGLAQADAEADLKTLSSVGAPPRVRRTLSGFQCGVVAVMGVVLGSAAGVLPAVGLRLTERREQMDQYRQMYASGWGDGSVPYVPIVIPWETIGALLIAVPLGAALLAALVTRSHRTLGRRSAT
ncbi:ABC transporter permease [Streptomyces paludis]|uniref:ABC transporter permease n=1 Tax=Streptomyces paludis TaxID=2282738 RepID=A0A345HQI6_9ACTN|nr:ABC transporter permease [Streptomyces paludis]AXG78960.1 ABC transporter permease [Streptomyces paludis]